ncbi:MAG TPA: class I SAM-dependent methyltransferase [Bacteroidota bacterium]|nr:class I SAM-dependent methyltransferase [Bacteroidota bacterium]
METERNRICPVELSSSLDSKLRRWLQNPHTILAPYVKEGMTVLDVGCGPGFFSLEMARMVGAGGKVISADVQDGMLQELSNKVRGTELEKRITPVKCDQGRINVSEMVDFILAFYMVHEVPDKNSLFRQMKEILKKQGQILLVEPKLFHVSRRAFAVTTTVAESLGFKAYPGPRLGLSWSALLRLA